MGCWPRRTRKSFRSESMDNGASSPLPAPPAHVAIIMDGNGRWAKSRGLPRIAGHRRGADAVRRSVAAAAEFGIAYLTLFGFSSENCRRPVDEIDDLMGLLRHYLRGEIAELHSDRVRLRVIGERSRLPAGIVPLIDNAESLTNDNPGLRLTIALSHAGPAAIPPAAPPVAAAGQARRPRPGAGRRSPVP